VVYYDGEGNSYYDQFYEPYLHYAAPIFAIPGNHDGDVAIPSAGQTPPPSLAGFMVNLCSASPVVEPDARDVPRQAMTQPNCYWTLEAPLLTIIGLYTNCPDHSVVEQDQTDWFFGELTAAAKDRALIVALHHPPYSGDSHHGSSAAMRSLLEQTFTATGRQPDLVVDRPRSQLPTLVCHAWQQLRRLRGRGGRRYYNLHSMGYVDGRPPPTPWTDPQTGATLEAYNKEHRHGFLRLTVDKNQIAGVYTTVPRPQESWSTGPVTAIDNFNIPLSL
jgi:hypothetical protein